MKQLTVAAAAFLVGASVVEAQGPGAMTGKTSIAFSIPQSGSTSFGVWKQQTPVRALGIESSLQYGRHDYRSSNSETRELQIGVAPVMKWYRATSGNVAPFLRGSAGVGYNRIEQQTGDVGVERGGFNINASVGLGVDWFPLSGISIGGFTGLGATFGKTNPSLADTRSLFIGTNTSSITMHIYFGGPSQKS